MKNLLLDARGLRRASAAVAMVAGSILLVAPVAGASAGETPEAATAGQARAEANAPEQRADGQATSAAASEQGQQASAGQRTTTPPAHSNAGGNASGAPQPNNGAAEPESPGASGTHKHTICHRTRSATNPYVQITIDFHAVDGELVEATSDHAERHDGPVFDSSMSSGDAWGDIIPPFTTEDGDSFEGQNWDDGQAIFENGCELPATETETGGEVVEEEEDDEELAPIVGGEEVTDEQPAVEEQPATDVEGDVVTRDQTPTVGTDVLGLAAPASDTQVLGAVVTRTPTEVGGAQVSSLPRTGNATGLLAAAGAALVGLGLVLVRGTRRMSPTA
ncbi:MAG TPA: LPXTG cell wall anchor domain-containing protein [Acidimicrobiales bacterium]|nr:LPXTG cell wall anchor domain-containing protein [Acidimicrobiales bacterium]